MPIDDELIKELRAYALWLKRKEIANKPVLDLTQEELELIFSTIKEIEDGEE